MWEAGLFGLSAVSKASLSERAGACDCETAVGGVVQGFADAVMHGPWRRRDGQTTDGRGGASRMRGQQCTQ